MILAVAAVAMAAQAPNTWQMGGGRTWMSPPTPQACPRKYPCSPADFRVAMAKGKAMLEAMARGGDVWAMRGLGHMLLNSVGADHDPAGAMGWFYEAAVRGDRESMQMLAIGFRDGLGVDADPKLSKFWLDRSLASPHDSVPATYFAYSIAKQCGPEPLQKIIFTWLDDERLALVYDGTLEAGNIDCLRGWAAGPNAGMANGMMTIASDVWPPAASKPSRQPDKRDR